MELGTAILLVISSRELSPFMGTVPSGISAAVAYGHLLFVVSALVAIFVIDLKYGIIPDKIVMPTIFLVTGYWLLITGSKVLRLYYDLKGDTQGLGPYLLQTDYFKNHVFLEIKPFLLTVAGSLFISSIFYFLIVITRGRGMGFGDVKLGVLVGIVSGFPKMLVAVFLSFLMGAVVSVILILMGRKRFGETVPFGPFLVLGTFMSLLFGDAILNWYLGLL